MLRSRNVLTLTFAVVSIAACSFTQDLDSYSRNYGVCPKPQKYCGGGCKDPDPSVGCSERSCTPCLEEPFPNARSLCSEDGFCAATCKDNFESCNNDDSDGCEVYLLDNAQHCGRCGHDCHGGVCRQGVCQPFVLADRQQSPIDMAQDSLSIFFSNYAGSTVLRVSKQAKTSLEASSVASDQSGPWGVSVTGTLVYWGANTTPTFKIYSAGAYATSGTPGQIAAGNGSIRGIAADDTFVFACNYDVVDGANVGKLLRVGVNPPFTVTSFNANHPTDVALSATDVFWANEGDKASSGSIVRLKRIESEGTLAREMAKEQNRPRSIAIDSLQVYWVNGGSVDRNDGSIMRADLATSTPVRLVGNLSDPRALAIDATHIYFTTKSAGILRVRKDAAADSAAEIIVSEQPNPQAIAVDDTFIYWLNSAANASGQVLRLAKP